MINWLQKKCTEMVQQERSSHRLAISFCVGVYIAFSPFIGLHTVITFFVAWLFGLNIVALLGSRLLINNPWTMVPLYSAGNFFGNNFCMYLFGTTMFEQNPSWMSWINEPLTQYVGVSGISFWSFFIGTNLLGIAIGVILYPVMRYVFTRLIIAHHGSYN
ncbi:MAG TPA: DUF2062 domain-containing protein [Candidatus Babeliales bacterium]|nr:DUF2062 domain-containing protein [Candidatus Babeliales bacterium]